MKLLNNICWIGKHTFLYENRQTVTRPHFPKQAWLTRIREKLQQKIKVEFSLDFSTVRNDGSTKCQIKERKWWSQLLNQLRVDGHCAHHLIQLKRGQNEIEFKGICVGRADGWMEGGGYWLRAWVAVDDKWPTKTKTSQLWREKNDQHSFKLHQKKGHKDSQTPVVCTWVRNDNSSRFQDIYVLDEHNLIVSLAKWQFKEESNIEVSYLEGFCLWREGGSSVSTPTHACF